MNTISVAALLGFVAVAMGAFGGHALKNTLSPDDLNIWEIGARYHFFHALAMLAVGLMIQQSVIAHKWLSAVPWAFGVGIVLFSGSLYLMALTQKKWLGAITPLGGLLFMAGWLLLTVAAWKR